MSQSQAFVNTDLAWEPSVVPMFAAEYASRPEEGLRGVQMQLQTRVRAVLEAAIETGLLKRFDKAVLRVRPFDDDRAQRRVDVRVYPSSPKVEAASSSWISSKLLSSTSSAQGEAHQSFSASWAGHPGHDASGSSGEGSEWQWTADRQWDFLNDWDWTLAWQQLRQFLWQWRMVVLVISVILLSAASATLIPAAGGAVVPSMAASSAPAASAVGTAAAVATAMQPSLLTSMLQVGMGVSTTAVPLVTAAYLWSHRLEIAAYLTAAVGLLLLFKHIWRLPLSSENSRPVAECCPRHRQRDTIGRSRRRQTTSRKSFGIQSHELQSSHSPSPNCKRTPTKSEVDPTWASSEAESFVLCERQMQSSDDDQRQGQQSRVVVGQSPDRASLGCARE